jgi:ribosomal protein L21E
MVQKSRGPRRKSRHKMMAVTKPTVNQMLQTFAIGEKVHFALQPNIKGTGYPYIMYKGVTGKVAAKRGSAYVVKFMDKDAEKTLIVPPVHLRRLGAAPAEKAAQAAEQKA